MISFLHSANNINQMRAALCLTEWRNGLQAPMPQKYKHQKHFQCQTSAGTYNSGKWQTGGVYKAKRCCCDWIG